LNDFRSRTWTEFAEDQAIGLYLLIGGARACIWCLLFVAAVVIR
jgi:hypothetical protein